MVNKKLLIDPKFAHVGRNDPCPCKSGKKFKKCCESKKYDAPKPPNSAKPTENAKPTDNAKPAEHIATHTENGTSKPDTK